MENLPIEKTDQTDGEFKTIEGCDGHIAVGKDEGDPKGSCSHVTFGCINEEKGKDCPNNLAGMFCTNVCMQKLMQKYMNLLIESGKIKCTDVSELPL